MKCFIFIIRLLVLGLFQRNGSEVGDVDNIKYRIIVPTLFFLFISSALYGQNGVVHDTSFVQDGLLRSYLLYVPDVYNGEEDWPLVINYHGFSMNVNFYMDATQMNAFADTGHFLVAYPRGLKVENLSGAINWGWNVPGYVADHDDVAFTNSLIDHIATDFKISLTQIHAAGYSNGSRMAFYLACALPDRIASVAGVSGVMTKSLLDLCQIGRPFSILYIHGTADPLSPFNGNSQDPPASTTPSFWASHNNCSPDSIVTDLPDIVSEDSSTVTLIEYVNCDDNSEIFFYIVNNGGHTWPGADSLPGYEYLGYINQDIDANSVIWNFFKHNPLTGIADIVNNSVKTFQLFPNYPNPFNPSTSIEFTLPKSEFVELKVYNILGKEVATLVSNKLNSGNHTYTFDGRNLASGVYYYQLAAGDYRDVKKMILIK